MSKVALSGNASGTGTVTLASPNTNNNPTFTLPSADGTSGQVLSTDGSGALSFTSQPSLASPLAVTGNSTAGAEIRLPEDTDNGSNYVALKAADNIASNVTFTLPSADGTNGQVLQTNGSGTLSFATPSAGAMTFITSVTASNSATVNFDSTYITSTYDVYVIQMTSVLPATDDVSISINVSSNNGSTFPYSWNNTGAGFSSNGSNVSGVGGGQNKLTGGLTASATEQTLSNVSGETFNCTMYIYKPSAANKFQCTWNASWIAAPTAAVCWVGMSATNNSATAVNYIRFSMSSGNIASGTFRLYGITNS